MSGRGHPRPERERYQKASWGERIGGDIASLRRNPWVVVIAVLVLGGGILLRVLTPQVVQVRDLVAGDCLYIRAADADPDDVGTAPTIGTAAAAVAALYGQGAERAPCDGSHSHEVLASTVFEDNAVAAYPGTSTLVDRLRPTCVAAFDAYVGHPEAGSALRLIVGVPDEAAWAAPVRTGVCLLASADGEFLSQPAKGSGG